MNTGKDVNFFLLLIQLSFKRNTVSLQQANISNDGART